VEKKNKNKNKNKKRRRSHCVMFTYDRTTSRLGAQHGAANQTERCLASDGATIFASGIEVLGVEILIETR